MWFQVASLERAGAISKMVGYTLHDPFNPPSCCHAEAQGG